MSVGDVVDASGAVLRCPKHMVYGPCGGVRPDGDCELGDRRCPFVVESLRRWDGPVVGGGDEPSTGLLATAAGRPVVLTDLTVAPYDVTSVNRIVSILAPSADGLLVGEHQNRPDLPPTLFAAEVQRAGGRPWITLTCRDRNRVVLEQEVAGLAALAVDGVLAVTGDARGRSVRPEVTQVFDLDGTRLAALARAAGLTVAVPESPQSPPIDLRPARLAEKQRAGASLCILNHVQDAAAAGDFVAASRAAGATLPFIASVAVYTDERSAAVLSAFPGLHLNPVDVAAVLDAGDPVTAGIEAAVTEARSLLAVDGVVGVNLSGLGSAAGLEAAARIKAIIGRELRQP